MADKEIIIGTDEDVITLMYATSVKESPDIKTSTTNTFSGAVVQGASNVSYELEIDKIRYEGVDRHIEISEKLDSMLSIKDDITVIDTVYPSGETPYRVIKRYHNCLVSDNNYELKPEEHTVEGLKFVCESRTNEWDY